MRKKNIFIKEYSDLFTIYGYGIDTIQHILHSLGYEYQDLDRKSTRKEGLSVIEQLLEYDIIYVAHWGKYHDIIKPLNLNIKQTMTYIETLWFEGASYKDFEDIINFAYQKWYLKKLEDEGIDTNTDWKWFSEKFVPNIEQWIKKKES